MTMRVTPKVNVKGEAGADLLAGTTYTVSDAFGAALVGSGRAVDFDGVLNPKDGRVARWNVKGTTLVDPETGNDVSLGGASVPPSINAGITVFEENGSVSKRCMPRNERILKSGSKWFSPTALTGTAARTCVLDTTDYFVAADQSTAPGVLITCLTAGFVGSTGWSTNLPMPSDGLLQALVWVDDFENGQPWSSGSLQLTLTGASGNIQYTFAAGAFKPGLNTLQLWNPSTPADAVCSKAGLSTAVNSGYDFVGNVTGVSLIINSMQLNAKMRFLGVWTQTKIKPMLAITFDTSAQNVFTGFVAPWQAAGFYCNLRSGGADSYRSPTWDVPLLAAYNAGHDVYNGSWTRLNLTQSTTPAELSKEVVYQNNYMQRRGYKRGATLFSSAGNALPKASVYREVFPKHGIKSAKGGTGFGRANFFGPVGLDDRYNLIVQGYPGITTAMAQIEGLIYTGGLLMYFMHDAPAGRVTINTVPSVNGGGIWAEDVPELSAFLQSKGTSAIEVVVQSTIDNVLDGLA